MFALRGRQMGDDKKDWAGIISNVTTKTKVLALIALVAEALFLGALTRLQDQQLLYALFACAGILVVTIIGIVVVEVTEARVSRPQPTWLTPSPLTQSSEFLDELINSAIQTVCRAISLPETPQTARLRVFIFRKKDNELVCSHFWSQDPVTEKVGKLKFNLNSEVAQNVAVVRAAIDDKICRTVVEPLPADIKRVSEDVADDLTFVLAAPIKDSKDQIWGTVDFDTASEAGKTMLSTDVSNAVMFQLARHLSVIFSLENQGLIS